MFLYSLPSRRSDFHLKFIFSYVERAGQKAKFATPVLQEPENTLKKLYVVFKVQSVSELSQRLNIFINI